MTDTNEDGVARLRDALGAAGHGWRVAQEAIDRDVAEHRREVDRLNDDLRRMGVEREQLRQRMAAENEKLRESRDEWKSIARECEAGTFKVTDGTLDDWIAAMRRGNDIIFSHARAAGLADEIERLRAAAGGER